MQRDFTVTREMAITLCDAVLNGEVEPSGLATIGFTLMASDKFSWNGEDILGEIIADWSCPEVNYPLTIENVKRFRAWLTGSEAYPAKSAKGEQGSRIVSVRYKNRRDPSQT